MSIRASRTRLALAALAMVAPFAAKAQSPPALPVAVQASDAALAWGPCPAFLPAGCRIAVLHGDPARPNVDVLFQVPGGADLPRHTHTSAERMVLVSGKLEVTYDGQPAMTLVPGTYAYGPAGMPHEGKCVGSEACVLFIAFEAPLDAIAAPR
jgi:quercetin dioxygenase-like cupin family protein